ncbi:MAG: nitrilase-related carbon-nitrogen hydrolase [Pseudomonadales bacterium]|nr:nitrilase-related carbon-nitrogen hydrolase [Pseudomonadales bacterium]MDP6473173.1 nitrilase-related carbon-nitrogen hydrolase [Pseudomonadales bacterium]MDP6826069.1 nitrilase-related carbon-nitrogen hydrolase [Pseudomonadales bacterium]MDP6971405.1 nitrilase-related carbon-nitrogen hydrolase [Pseudomonadales bacterium]
MSTNVSEVSKVSDALEVPEVSIERIWGVPKNAWLALGLVVMVFIGNRYNVAPLAWVAAVPLLLYMRQRSGWRDGVVLFLALQVWGFFALLKIVTDPLPVTFAFMFSIPVALSTYVLYEVFEVMRRRLGDGWGVVLFPALTVLDEWIASYTSPMGSWGSLAYTQIDNLALMQLASVTGLTGISALLACTSVLVAVLIASADRRRYFAPIAIVVILAVAAHGFGALRLEQTIEGPMVSVAGVVSGRAINGGMKADDEAEQQALFTLSQNAAERGAELIVWNETATIVSAAREAAMVERGQQLASNYGVDLVMAYGVPQADTGRFANKYVWLTPQGGIETYLKHHPVPGEPSIAGTEPLVVHERPYGQAAGAICYDYDFPAMGKTHAKLGAGLVVVPSADWKGIDPYHTQMASVRGIEGGFSVVRPVWASTSGAYDAYGRARATMSYYEGESLFIARVPTTRIDTLYSRIGEVVAPLALICLLAGLVRLLLNRRSAG